MKNLLLHIGYHKTGTTWLQREGFSLLDGCVRIHGPNVKAAARSIVYNDKATGINELRAFAEASSARHPIISYEIFSGAIMEGAPEQQRTAARLAAAFPDARVLVVVRSQPEMLESFHAQYVNQGGTASLGEFLDGLADGVAWNPDHLNYDALVSVYVELFRNENVLVMPYELLRGHPEQFLFKLAEFLGTKVVGPVHPSIVNPSLSGTRLELLRRWNRITRRSRFNPRPILPLPRSSKMRWLLQRHATPRRGVDIRSTEFSQRYSSSNQRLQLWCDLKGWGYPGVD